MPIVNYISENEAFTMYASYEKLSSSERLVWAALFHIMNRRADGANWPGGFVRIPNDWLLVLLPFGFDTMSRARNKLAQRGLISFVHGSRNSAVPMYQMHYLTLQGGKGPKAGDRAAGSPVPAAVADCQEDYPETADNSGDSPGVSPVHKPEGSSAGSAAASFPDNPGDIYVKPNVTRIPLHDSTDEEGVDQRTRACDASSLFDDTQEAGDPFLFPAERGPEDALAIRVAEEIRLMFGYRATTEESWRIAMLATMYHLEPDLVDESIRLAAMNHAHSLYAYLLAVYQEWHLNDVRTLNEYGRYCFAKDMRMGRLDGRAYPEYKQILEQELEERRKKHRAQDAIRKGDAWPEPPGTDGESMPLSSGSDGPGV